ncbi:MAG TPA: AAA family ATPase [Planctomycetota bacterium]|nr:AAA family ATPase [Planctomycetota bacterium]
MTDSSSLATELAGIRSRVTGLFDDLSRSIVGQEQVLKLLAACLLSRGHALIIGMPGLAKTTMVKNLAQCMTLHFKRIQFTPDMMPSDITGSLVLREGAPGSAPKFEFTAGPIFANIVLADEINRSPPKTQAALLEAMAEYQVTVGNDSHRLPDPFFVIATQNPIEQEGTYELPEAQLDRFLFMIKVEYPSQREEEKILAQTPDSVRKFAPTFAMPAEELLAIQETVRKLTAVPAVTAAVARLIRATRPQDERSPDFIKKYVEWGVGPRAGQHLLMAARAWAAMAGKPQVTLNEITAVAAPVLRHRLGLNYAARAEGLTADILIERLLALWIKQGA